MTQEKKSEIFGCILNQFPDEGIYRINRVEEWLSTNGYSMKELGYEDFSAFAADFPEALKLHPMDGGKTYVIIKSWAGGAKRNDAVHPADGFFGSHNLILNDDIIEMSQQSLYALTKVLGNGLSVQEMKQYIYDRFAAAKQEDALNFFAERYTFPIDCCVDGFLVNGIITKNLSLRGKSLYFSFEKTAIYNSDFSRTAPRALSTKPVSESDKAEIYRLLSQNFPFDRPQHMAAVSKLLTDNNIDRTKYGFVKMKELLAQMDYLKLEDVVLGGVPQIMVTLRRSSEYAVQSRSEQREHADVVPQLPLEEFCNLPPKPLSILQSFLRDENIAADISIDDIRVVLCKDFEGVIGGTFYKKFPCGVWGETP